MYKGPLIFFVYPDPANWREAKNRTPLAVELGAAKINLLPLGLG
jgi:hypothetical protein